MPKELFSYLTAIWSVIDVSVFLAILFCLNWEPERPSVLDFHKHWMPQRHVCRWLSRGAATRKHKYSSPKMFPEASPHQLCNPCPSRRPSLQHHKTPTNTHKHHFCLSYSEGTNDLHLRYTWAVRCIYKKHSRQQKVHGAFSQDLSRKRLLCPWSFRSYNPTSLVTILMSFDVFDIYNEAVSIIYSFSKVNGPHSCNRSRINCL